MEEQRYAAYSEESSQKTPKHISGGEMREQQRTLYSLNKHTTSYYVQGCMISTKIVNKRHNSCSLGNFYPLVEIHNKQTILGRDKEDLAV